MPHCGAPGPRRGAPRCVTACLSAGRGTALTSHCTRASQWHSCLRCRSRPTHLTHVVYAHSWLPTPSELLIYTLRVNRSGLNEDVCTQYSFVSTTAMFELGCSSPYLGRPFLLFHLCLWLGFWTTALGNLKSFEVRNQMDKVRGGTRTGCWGQDEE
jgi:hypothetical protein